MAKPRKSKVSDSGEFVPATRINESTADIVYMLAASGLKASEIANASGFPHDFVVKALRRNGAREMIQDFQQKLFGDDLTKRLKPMAMKALNVVDELISDPKTKANIRLSAAQDVLDRTLGKPKQFFEHTDGYLKDIYRKIDDLIEAKTQAKTITVESREKIVDTNHEIEQPDKDGPPHDEIDDYFKKRDEEKT